MPRCSMLVAVLLSRRVVAFGEHDVWLVHIGTDGVPQVVRWQPERIVW